MPTTQNAYVQTVRSLLAEMRNQLKPVEPPQVSPPPQDPIRVIVGGNYPPITYGWLADVGLSYYTYGVGHGTQRATQHTGVDVGVLDETPLYSPGAGRVLCVGGAGQNTWGQGCGAYADTMGGGVGNITILLDSGHKLTLGHCSSATVRPGDSVTAGQRVGRSGGMNGDHVHIEVAVERNGTYWLVDPIPALKEAMGGTPVLTQPAYTERLPVPQPGEFEQAWTIEVTADRVPVKQLTHPNATDVAAPLTRGEQFKAPMMVIGLDGQDWWISLRGGRVPVAGTKKL